MVDLTHIFGASSHGCIPGAVLQVAFPMSGGTGARKSLRFFHVFPTSAPGISHTKFVEFSIRIIFLMGYFYGPSVMFDNCNML